MGQINVTEANGQLGGTLNINSQVFGLCLTGVTASPYTAGTPILVTSLADVVAAGIVAATNAFAYRQLQEFYNEAPVGTQLYVMLVPATVTAATMWDKTVSTTQVKLLNFANGKIKVLFGMTDDKAVHTAGGTITITNGLNADCYTGAANAKALEVVYRAAGKPFRAVIGATSYSGTASALTDETSGTSNNKCAILLGDSQVYDATYPVSCIGLLAGKLASCNVQEKVSKVELGALSIAAAYLAGSTVEAAGGDAATIAGKGFITFTTYPTKSGYFFSGDPMMTATTDDYNILARCRVIDKAHVIALDTLTNEVDSDVPTIAGGLIDPGYATWLQNRVINAVSTNMPSSEISGVDCFIDLTQNVISNPTLNVVLKIRPKGYLTDIEVKLGFEL